MHERTGRYLSDECVARIEQVCDLYLKSGSMFFCLGAPGACFV